MLSIALHVAENKILYVDDEFTTVSTKIINVVGDNIFFSEGIHNFLSDRQQCVAVNNKIK